MANINNQTTTPTRSIKGRVVFFMLKSGKVSPNNRKLHRFYIFNVDFTVCFSISEMLCSF